MEVLAGDVGGTKVIVAILDVDLDGGHPRARVLDSRRYESRRFPGLEALCRAFAAETGRALPRRAGFGVAGPVASGRCRTTNLPWVLDEGDLREKLGADRVALANDFCALGLGLPFVQPEHLVALNEAAPDPRGPQGVLGAGTGLGQCICLTLPDGRREVLPTEGGHCDFAPRGEAEIAVLRFLGRRFDHVSWERVLSGDGLVSIAEALAWSEGVPVPGPLAEQIALDRSEAPERVTELARAGDPICGQALRMFCSLYGAEAGNLGLKILATGGIYVAGGIAPRILTELTDGRFREAFLGKGRMRRLLESIPVHVVLDPLTALYGAAALAATDPRPA